MRNYRFKWKSLLWTWASGWVRVSSAGSIVYGECWVRRSSELSRLWTNLMAVSRSSALMTGVPLCNMVYMSVMIVCISVVICWLYAFSIECATQSPHELMMSSRVLIRATSILSRSTWSCTRLLPGKRSAACSACSNRCLRRVSRSMSCCFLCRMCQLSSRSLECATRLLMSCSISVMNRSINLNIWSRVSDRSRVAGVFRGSIIWASHWSPHARCLARATRSVCTRDAWSFAWCTARDTRSVAASTSASLVVRPTQKLVIATSVKMNSLNISLVCWHLQRGPDEFLGVNRSDQQTPQSGSSWSAITISIPIT